jgi:hypothetical protein
VTGWATAQEGEKERGRGETRPKGRKEKSEGKKIPFSFSNTFSNCVFLNEFMSKRYFVFKTIITIKMHQHVCNKNVILNLYLILIPQKLLLIFFILMVTKLTR